MSKKKGGLLSWWAPRQDSPGTAPANSEWVDQAWGAKLVGKGGGYFDTTPLVSSSV